MNQDNLIQILIIVLIPIVFLILSLVGFLVYLIFKDKKKYKDESLVATKEDVNKTVSTKQSVFNFMEFDTIKDNMIIQKDHKKFLMVIELQGINYDLMSKIEKTSVEEGFVQFLNALRYQIQIYIQTRSINLENSLEIYRQKVNEVEMKLNKMKMQYEAMTESGTYTNQQLQKAFYELTKQSNLYEYGKSILQDTEKMSLNKSILSKKYYIIVPYFASESGSDKLDNDEIEGIAFSELYTRAQSLIKSISTCGVRGKILKSHELIELLYMAYNREEAETFGLDKAIKAGYNEMYSTAPDVLNKKMQEIDKIIEEKALNKAREKVNEAQTEIEKQLKDKEENLDELIAEMAKIIIEENREYIGKDVEQKAIEKIDNEITKEGGVNNVKKTTRGRKKASI